MPQLCSFPPSLSLSLLIHCEKNEAGVAEKRVRSREGLCCILRVVHLNCTSNRVKKVYENDWLWFRTVDSANRAMVVSSVWDIAQEYNFNCTSNWVKKVYENDWLWFRTVDGANRAMVVLSVWVGMTHTSTFQLYIELGQKSVRKRLDVVSYS